MYRKHNYLIPIPYLFSTIIREYDIEKANINILYKYGVLSTDQYNHYISVDRMTRQVDIGNMIKYNKEFGTILRKGITEAKRLFFIENDLNVNKILSIKNDAVYTIDCIPKYTQFDNIKFNLKNIYDSFMIINKIEYYYYLDIINKKEILDIKGISEEKLQLHKNYFMDFLMYMFSLIQTSDIVECINTIQSFYLNYINFKLPIEYYRSFDRIGKYMIGYDKIIATCDCISKTDLQYINISCNRIILETFYSYLTNIYFSRKHKNRR